MDLFLDAVIVEGALLLCMIKRRRTTEHEPFHLKYHRMDRGVFTEEEWLHHFLFAKNDTTRRAHALH